MMPNNNNTIKKIFSIKSAGEAAFVVVLALFVATLINITYLQHHQRYHKFILNSNAADEVFIEKMKSGTIVLHKTKDARSGYPRIIYKITLETNKTLEGELLVGEFELYPSQVIFEDINGSIQYVDQYKKPLTAQSFDAN
jgi:hypothetical protein